MPVVHRIISSALAVALTTGHPAHIPTEQIAPPHVVRVVVYVPPMWRDTVPIPDPPTPPAEVAVEVPSVSVVPVNRPAVMSTQDDDPMVVAIVTAAADEFDVDVDLMLRIGRCESHLNPDAKNPRSSAAGLFQHLAQYWPGRAEAVGMAGASVYDPTANARVTAWMLSTQGTAPWVSSKSCWNRRV